MSCYALRYIRCAVPKSSVRCYAYQPTHMPRDAATDIAYVVLPLSAYARAMRCPVLTTLIRLRRLRSSQQPTAC
eukprot:3860850-Rhodomonas_salina.3